MSIVSSHAGDLAFSPAATKAPPVRRRRLARGRAVPLGRLLGPALLVVVWSFGSVLGLIDPRTLPAPWSVIGTAFELVLDGRLQTNLATSAIRVAQGLVIGTVIGTLLALISGLSRIGEAVIDGPVQIKQAVPTLALIPLLMLWFGIGETMKVVVIVLAVAVPIYIQTHDSLRSIDNRYVELARTLRMGYPEFIRQVILPGALPGFFVGLRFATAHAWLALVVVEQINATSGIGYMIDLARSYGQIDIILVGIVLYAVLGLISDGVVRFLQQRALSWRRTLAD
ncbi:sulfonate transport system permease protein [Rhizobium leguminosarum]|uniref:Sulfonate transport system permease protein n=1 Tax=Rhizobium leguminosarum TaxID=384 RepID=A0AAE2MR74_RHILE|nr:MULTISPECIES: ABC transporter permease [Rhizobium]MBB4293660.1 sulfonate transport system permease protein [Rhizobium leguminosarum]MBB4300317.1 sulfonate transport system permease protein [Rhizobium leguminosarum]MBB4311588.1 sulfonate transport system permease protein [Rhizobium leguminosarum]MBB4420403.1 sulfonate transport system permease protein [Rhizobium leguminosarum]MBB4435742.1 sulfonate transport system permease protein [Rhizobium esperanzae]